MQEAHPTLEDVRSAAIRVAETARVTEARLSEHLSDLTGVSVWLKLECEQATGSFKVRGAANALLQLDPEERRAGVVAVSSGNHGRAVAYVAGRLGVAATICISSRVPAVKVDSMEALGAEVIVAGADQDDADAAARRLVAQGKTFIHPFDDPMVIAGQGTIGLELVEQVPGMGHLIIPLSGGGLAGGIALAVKALRPEVSVTGVSQERGPAMVRSMAAGRLVDVVEEDTLADALAGGLGPENRHSFDLCRSLLDDTTLVSEAEIARAMALLRREEGLVVEGGGAVGVAALLSGSLRHEGEVVVVVSGGNVAPETLAEVMAG